MFFYCEYRKYVSNHMLIPKHITCCVSIFNLYRMSIYYLHTGTWSYLVVHILTVLKLLACITTEFIVNIFQSIFDYSAMKHILYTFLHHSFFKLFFYVSVGLRCTITITMVSKDIHKQTCNIVYGE